MFHHLNAWEEEGDVVVESIYYNDFPSIGPEMDFTAVDFDLIPEGLLEQCRINLETGHVETNRLSERCCEFAMVILRGKACHVATPGWLRRRALRAMIPCR